MPLPSRPIFTDDDSYLDKLPTELLEKIGGYLIHSRIDRFGDHPAASEITALRSVRRSIRDKVEDCFKKCFAHRYVTLSFAQLIHLSIIAVDKRYSHLVVELDDMTLASQAKVRTWQNLNNRVEEILEGYEPPELQDLITPVYDSLLKIEKCEEGMAYLERSGMGCVLLHRCLVNLPNLRKICIDQCVLEEELRSGERYGNGTLSRVFSTWLGAIITSCIQLEEIKAPRAIYPGRQGIAVEEIPPTGKCLPLQRLRKLQLVLSTRARVWQGPHEHWKKYVSGMLQAAPRLQELNLGFDDKRDTIDIFSNIAQDCQWSHLTKLRLSDFDIRTQHLQLVLSKHTTTLEVFEMLDCSFEDTSWEQVIETLSTLPRLKRFAACYIAEDGLRTTFPTTGGEANWTFDEDRVWFMSGPPDKYTVSAGPGGNVKDRLDAIRADFTIEDMPAWIFQQ